MHPLNHNTINKQDKSMSQGETRALVVEAQLHFVQPLVPNQMNMVPPHVIDTTIPPPLITRKETEELRHILWITQRRRKKTMTS